VEAYLVDWTNLLVRWLHVIAGIAWIGESIYFVMLDNSLHPPRSAASKQLGVYGEMWAVHGGGFYHNQKFLTNPPELPDDLHWSFWKSYTTWLSGFALFALLYLANASIYLVNKASPWAWAAGLSGVAASLVAIAFLLVGWLVYDQMCRRISPNVERDGLLSIAVAAMMIAVAYLSTQIFQGRAAFVITGAVMATSMSANVYFWIIPGQRRMVNDIKAGKEPDALDGKRGKQRSVHNTYFTLPVVLLMISNHYAFSFSSSYAWVLMSLLIIAGAVIRQYFVLRHSGRNVLALPALGAALIVIAMVLGAPTGGWPTAPEKVTYAQVDPILRTRCTSCHANQPTQPGFTAPPQGIRMDDEVGVKANLIKIKQAVANRYMPLGNLTQMTEAERQVIAQWDGS
jgi:uncharacterized membrane protein